MVFFKVEGAAPAEDVVATEGRVGDAVLGDVVLEIGAGNGVILD